MSLSTHQPLHMAVMAQSIKDLEPRGLFNLSLFNKYRWLYDVVWYGCPLLIFDVWLCSYTTFLLLVSLMSAMVTTLLLWLYLSDSCYKAQMEFIKGQVNKNNTLFGSAIPLARSVKKTQPSLLDKIKLVRMFRNSEILKPNMSWRLQEQWREFYITMDWEVADQERLPCFKVDTFKRDWNVPLPRWTS